MANSQSDCYTLVAIIDFRIDGLNKGAHPNFCALSLDNIINLKCHKSISTKGSLTTVFINFDSKLSTNQLSANTLLESRVKNCFFFSYTYVLKQNHSVACLLRYQSVLKFFYCCLKVFL